jgi:hypothetical protein
MEYSTKHRRQKRKDTSIVISKGVLFHEARLLTNATVVDDAIRFVSQQSKEKLKSSDSNEDGKESKESDYDDEYEDQLEEEQEEETGEVTTNQVF